MCTRNHTVGIKPSKRLSLQRFPLLCPLGLHQWENGLYILIMRELGVEMWTLKIMIDTHCILTYFGHWGSTPLFIINWVEVIHQCVIHVNQINPPHSSHNCQVWYTHAVWYNIFQHKELVILHQVPLSTSLLVFFHFHGHKARNGLHWVPVTKKFDAEIFRNRCICVTSLPCSVHGNMCGFCTT